jgi:hypothetical protein
LDEPRPAPPRLFRGTELPRLLLLLAIAVSGWALVWYYLSGPPAGPAESEPGVVVAGKPAAIEPDRSAEFETVADKAPLSFRDTAAYDKLLARSRAATAAGLAGQARRDVFYAHLWDRPAAFRGVPIHLLGTARRVLYYPSKLSRTGWIYEAWVVTPESRSNPYVCVFEEAPKGLPVGPDVSERVVFNGYFLKLLRYEAGDVPRAAPLLVGRLGWTPRPTGVDSPDRSLYWLAGGVAVMLGVSLVRWGLWLRWSLAPRPRPSLTRDRPVDDIAPEALARWLDEVPGEERP